MPTMRAGIAVEAAPVSALAARFTPDMIDACPVGKTFVRMGIDGA